MSENKPLAGNIRPYKDHTPRLGERVFVDAAAVVIGDVELGDDVSVWPCAVVRGDMHSIRVGKRTSIQDNVTLHITHASKFTRDGWPVNIGDDVTIGHGACLHGCTVGNRVLIGIGATILDGVVIEDNVMVAAGALVPPGKRLESGYLYVGNPAKQARALKESECAFFEYSANNYVALKDDYLNEQ